MILFHFCAPTRTLTVLSIKPAETTTPRISRFTRRAAVATCDDMSVVQLGCGEPRPGLQFLLRRHASHLRIASGWRARRSFAQAFGEVMMVAGIILDVDSLCNATPRCPAITSRDCQAPPFAHELTDTMHRSTVTHVWDPYMRFSNFTTHDDSGP